MTNLSQQMPLADIEKQRFNKWCLRHPLPIPQVLNRGFGFLKRKNLLPVEKALLYFHKTTKCNGIEFVFFSSAQIPKPVFLPRQIVLVPCFTITQPGPVDMSMRNIESRMGQNGRFIYDGWMPIKNWDDKQVRSAVRTIDEILSFFCIQGASAVWEPKYHPMRQPDWFSMTEDIQLLGHAKYFGVIDTMKKEDRGAFFKSLGWLSQGLQAKQPAAKLLFFFLAIESLATYIEKEALKYSCLRPLRHFQTSKPEKETCIRKIMKEKLASEPVKAVETAYFDCVKSISKMLESHVEENIPQKKDLLFEEKDNKPSLYNYRNKIAHGGLDALSEEELENARSRISDAESAARTYLLRIINLAIDHNKDLKQTFHDIECSPLPSDPKLASSFGEQEKEYHMGFIYNLPSP